MDCARPGGCRQRYGCAHIGRCWWTSPNTVKRRRLPALPARVTTAKDPNIAEPGYWLIRLVRRGPPVPACIKWLVTESEPGWPDNDMRGTRSPTLAAFIEDEPVDLYRVWHATKLAHIDEREYRFRCRGAAWAKKHAPHEAAANPRKPVDLLNQPAPTF